jgi:hypothetical protein
MTNEQRSTLTTEAVNDLKRPFAVQYHDFVRGFVYLAERAVCERIEQVDPGWSFEILSVSHYPERNRVNVTARMTILGVKREGIGSGTYLDTPVKDYETKEPKTNDLGEVMMNYSEAEKGAATDALRRCARLFGVGRYLLDTPKHIKNETGLANWLHSIGGQNQPPKQHQGNNNSPVQPKQNPPPKPSQDIPEGTKRTVTIVKRIRRSVEKGNPPHHFRTSELDGSLLVKAYSRQPFIEKFYCTENDWLEVDVVEELRFTCGIIMSKYGWWGFDFGSLPPYDPGFDALGNMSSSNPKDIPL